MFSTTGGTVKIEIEYPLHGLSERTLGVFLGAQMSGEEIILDFVPSRFLVAGIDVDVSTKNPDLHEHRIRLVAVKGTDSD